VSRIDVLVPKKLECGHGRQTH